MLVGFGAFGAAALAALILGCILWAIFGTDQWPR